MPLRESKLTMLLKGALIGPPQALCVVACISPCTGDTEHTLNTGQCALAMAGLKAAAPKHIPVMLKAKAEHAHTTPQPKHPNAWTRDEVVTWLQGLSDPQLCGCVARLPGSSAAGKDIARWAPIRFEQLAGSTEAGQALRRLWVAEKEHASAMASEARKQRARSGRG